MAGSRRFQSENANYGDIKISNHNSVPQPYKTAHNGKLQSHKNCGSGIYPAPYAGGRPNRHDNRGGGTAWRTAQAPVTPGQIFNLDFHIWDTGDQQFDSTILIDNFNRARTQTAVGTDFAAGGGGD